MTIASVGAVDVTSFVSGFTSEVEFEVSESTALHMDTAPTDIGSGGTLTVPIKSGFQTEMLALRAVMHISWTMRVAGHAQLITGTTW
jgi:hypothetical protein